PLAPAAAVRHPGAPRTGLMHAEARAFDRKSIGARHDPVEARVVVQDALDEAPEIGEELADLLLARRKTPLGKKHLRVVCKEIENAAARRGHSRVVESLQV